MKETLSGPGLPQLAVPPGCPGSVPLPDSPGPGATDQGDAPAVGAVPAGPQLDLESGENHTAFVLLEESPAAALS